MRCLLFMGMFCLGQVLQAQDLPLSKTSQKYKEGNWYNLVNRAWKYNQFDQPVEITKSRWRKSWQEKERTTYKYSVKGLLESELVEKKKGRENEWSLAIRTTYKYNLYDKVETILVEEHKGQGWINKQQSNLLYDAKTYVKLEDMQEVWDRAERKWKSSLHKRYEYDTVGSLKEVLVLKYSEVAEQWKNDEQKIYSYDGQGNLTGENIFYWSWDKWAERTKKTWKYKEDGRIIEEQNLLYDKALKKWRKLNKHEYNYDVQGEQVSKNIFIWKAETNSWELMHRELMELRERNVAPVKAVRKMPNEDEFSLGTE